MSKTMETQSLVAAVDDPFERLPEQILHHILALLRSVREAARTSVLSRTWHTAWSSYPIFDFHVWDFLPKAKDQFGPDELQRFHDFVDKAMSRLREQRITIPRFRLGATELGEDNRSCALFDKWIGMALDGGAEELHLDFDELALGDSYLVPTRVFSSGFIKTMTLKGQGLITPMASISIVNLSSLQSLKFFRNPFDGLMLQKLLRGCPLLEELELKSCDLLTQVIISGPNNLRRIVLFGQVNRVEIEAPHLEELECCNTIFCPWLTQVVLLDHCPRLKHLMLVDSPITQDRFHEILSKFPLLESLIIKYCWSLKKIVISNPLLEKIEIRECDDLVDIEIGSANLSCFRYGTRKPQLPIIRLLNPTALSVSEAYFGCNSIPILVPHWFIQLGEFLTRSCQFRSLAFGFYLPFGDEEIVQDKRDLLPLLPYDVDCLQLSVCTPPVEPCCSLEHAAVTVPSDNSTSYSAGSWL